MNFRIFATVAVMLGGWFAGPGVIAGEFVILESNAARFPPGGIIDASVTVDLDDGEALLLVADSGDLVAVEGPHTGIADRPAADETDITAALNRLIGSEDTRVVGIGGVRTGDVAGDADTKADTRPSPWLLHTGITGAQCVVPGQALQYWREDESETVTLHVTMLQEASAATLDWPAGTKRIDWPESLPVVDGEMYLVRPSDQMRSTNIQLFELPGPLDADRLSAAAWLAARGCMRQAGLMLKQRSR